MTNTEIPQIPEKHNGEDPSKSSTPENSSSRKTDKGKEIVVEKNPYQVMYKNQSLGTPNFTNLLNQVTSIKLD